MDSPCGSRIESREPLVQSRDSLSPRQIVQLLSQMGVPRNTHQAKIVEQRPNVQSGAAGNDRIPIPRSYCRERLLRKSFESRHGELLIRIDDVQ